MCIPETKNRDGLNDNDMRNKNTWCLALEKVVVLKGQVVKEIVVIAAWLAHRVAHRVCAFWPDFLAVFGLTGTVVAWCYYRCSFPSDCMCQEVAESCVLILLSFRLPPSMQRSERCEVRSEFVVSVTVQHISTELLSLSKKVIYLSNYCLWRILQSFASFGPFFHVFRLSFVSFAHLSPFFSSFG